MSTIEFSDGVAGGELYEVDHWESASWSRPQWRDAVWSDMRRISQRRSDWDLLAAERALQFLNDYRDLALPVPFVVDTREGGTQLEWDVAGIGIEVDFRPGGEILVVGEDDRTGEEWDGSLPDVQEELSRLIKQLAHRGHG